MAKESVTLAQVADALNALRQELSQLSERVATLEARAARASPAAAPSGPAAEGLSEELVLVLSAAIAAFLGKKAPIRQIRLISSAAWAQQGRVTIHASHERVLSRSER
jgi:methylmalonyl-CoA carboxyltransferase large subunit